MSTAISFNNVTIFQHDKAVLEDINIIIETGEFVYLVGKTGSGKSSFLKTLYADLELSNGSATIADIELCKIKRGKISELRRKLGIVFQDFQLLQDRDVYENLKFILKSTGWKDDKAIDERIKTVLRQVHLNDVEKKMPYAMSGGEQQRVSIARALLNNPDIILADEPTANLDPDTSGEIINLFKEIAISGKTIVIATHDYYMIKRFPGRILTFENGKVLENV
jgi:cell division transport system ATP-binding protein